MAQPIPLLIGAGVDVDSGPAELLRVLVHPASASIAEASAAAVVTWWRDGRRGERITALVSGCCRCRRRGVGFVYGGEQALVGDPAGDVPAGFVEDGQSGLFGGDQGVEGFVQRAVEGDGSREVDQFSYGQVGERVGGKFVGEGFGGGLGGEYAEVLAVGAGDGQCAVASLREQVLRVVKRSVAGQRRGRGLHDVAHGAAG